MRRALTPPACLAAGAALLTIVGLGRVPAAFAEPDMHEIMRPRLPAGTAALGGALRSRGGMYRDATRSLSEEWDLVPLLVYDGPHLFLRGLEAGLHIVRGDEVGLNLLMRYRFEGLDPEMDPFYEGLEPREHTVDAGVELVFGRGDGEFRLSWLTDTLDRHDGSSLEFTYSRTIEYGHWALSPFLTWSYYDRDLTDYYYGVSAAEASPDRPRYRPGSSHWLSTGVAASRRLSDRVEVFANAGLGSADASVTDSPLVADDYRLSAFVGASYVFGNVREPENYVSEERRSEWSWRVNYGYQAEGNIVGDIDRGDLRGNIYADTRVTGLTVGRLLSDGPRVDFQGRMAVFRHFEGGEGNGSFFSYAAYIMGFGHGYQPWSEEKLFRWGFGFGLSYAERLPFTEKREALQGKAAAHLQTYLELSVDVPLVRLARAEWFRNCYAGVSVVHRSGIFGSSDLLGDVSGGSDWVTAHLECARR